MRVSLQWRTVADSPVLIRLLVISWLGREDSNLRMAVPKTAALPLGYSPVPSRPGKVNRDSHNKLPAL
jgi:hypothetical protein